MASKTMLNGMKIIKRWSPSTMFSSLLLIILGSAIALCLVFLSWAKIDIVYTGGEIEKDIFELKNGYVFVQGSIFYLLGQGEKVSPSITPFFTFLEMILTKFMGAALGPIFAKVFISFIILTIALVILMSIIAVFTGLIGLLSGRVHNFKSFPRTAWWFFVFVLFETLVPLAMFFALPQFMNGVETESGIITSIKVDALPQMLYLGGALLIAIVISVIYGQAFHNGIYVKNIKALEAAQASRNASGYPGFGNQNINGYPTFSKPEVQIEKLAPASPQPSQPKKASSIQYNKTKGLPDDLTVIGGHAFTQNVNLEVAIIPLGISDIGPSAFANCINLQILSIPKSIKKIGYNAFFGCKKLVRINYGGKKTEWRQIQRGSNWLASAGTTTVVCTDGPITVNPYH